MDDDYIRRSEAIGITNETGAWETKKRLRELAAADVRAVVRAHNKLQESPGQFMCSGCGWRCIDTLKGETSFHFCPGCGAVLSG